jgi:hypothetical protein
MSKSLRIAFILIGLTLSATIIFLVLVARVAIQNHEPVMDSSYYEKGLDYEARVRSLKKGEEQGWVLDVPFQEGAEMPRGTSKLVLKLSGPAQPKSAALRVMVERPATAKYRQTIELNMSGAKAVPGGLEFPVEINLNERGTFEIFSEVRVNDEADVYVRRKVLVK